MHIDTRNFSGICRRLLFSSLAGMQHRRCDEAVMAQWLFEQTTCSKADLRVELGHLDDDSRMN